MAKFPSVSVVLILWFSGLCAAAQFAKDGLVLPELGEMYPGTGASLGFLVSSISFVGALLGLSTGALASQIGMRKLLVAGLALGSAVSLIQSIGLPMPILLASRVIEGFAHLAIVVSAPTLIALNSSQQIRPAAMTLWGTFFGVSFALTAWMGLPLVASKGVLALFFAHGVLMTAATLLVFLVVPTQKSDKSLAAENSLSFAFLKQRHISAWSSAFIAAPAAGWFFYTITFVALLAVLPGIATPEQRNFIATSLPIASILSSMTIGVLLLRWFSAVAVIIIGFAVAIGISLLLAVVADAAWISIALFAAMGLVQGASFASIPQLNKHTNDQALASGALAQAGNIGNAAGTPLLLLLLAVAGLNAVIATIVICYAAAIAIHCLLAKRRTMD